MFFFLFLILTEKHGPHISDLSYGRGIGLIFVALRQ
jgi:hypothetical protein